VIVVTDDDAAAAERHARELADWLWARRRDWLAPLVSVEEGLAQGEREGTYPIILADHADNTGGSAPGDSTEVLRTFFERGLDRALLMYMVDPETAAAAHAAGLGARVEIDVGGKSHPAQGPPVPMSAEVVGLSDGQFRYDGPMLAGLEGALGPSAAIRQDGVTVICVSRPMQPYDLALARALDVDCSVMRYICVKSAVHFRAGFRPLGGTIVNVDAAGVHTLDLRRLQYRKQREPMFGIDEL
jgi:microcystin degradation protein MlrC